MDTLPTRRKRKLPKQKQYDPVENSPDIEVPVPGSEAFISPTACDSPSLYSRKKTSPITVGTPTDSRTRHYLKPLRRPSENFADRLKRVIDGDDEFLSNHPIIPASSDDSLPADNDENKTPRTDEPKYTVIPRKVNGDKKGKRKVGAHAKLMSEKLVDTAIEAIVRPVYIPRASSPQPPPSPATSVSSDEDGLADLILPEPPIQEEPIPISPRAADMLSSRTRQPRRSVRLELLRRQGRLEWTCDEICKKETG